MLVFLSDIHLNDGTVCKQVNGDVAKIFFSRLKDQIYSAGFREDGTYQPVTSVDIVLLGDIFDLIRSSKWHTDHRGKQVVRPWDDISDWHYIVKDIAASIIRNNEEFLDTFKKASIFGLDIKLPENHNPLDDLQHECKNSHIRCSVNLHYMVGNHDWFLHVDDSRLDEVRTMIKRSLALSQDKFAWSIDEFNHEGNELRQLSRSHRVYFAHGDIYDSYNYHYFMGRKASSLGDAIVIELVTGFPIEVRNTLKRKFGNSVIPEKLERALQEIDNVRPSTQVPVYIRHIIDEHADESYKQNIKVIFDSCIDRLLNSKVVKTVGNHDKFLQFKIALLAFLSKKLPISLLRWLSSLSNLLPDDYQKAAIEEYDIQRDMCDYVVYGHTHEPTNPVGIGLKNNIPKIYINSSTWRPVHCEITQGKIDKGLPYFSYQNLVWVTFYKESERRGRKYEIWSGDMETHYESL